MWNNLYWNGKFRRIYPCFGFGTNCCVRILPASPVFGLVMGRDELFFFFFFLG